MDNAEQEWRAHVTQIHCIKADAKKSHTETLLTTNWIEEAIMMNNHIDCCLEEHLLKNRVIDLESLLGLQHTTL